MPWARVSRNFFRDLGLFSRTRNFDKNWVRFRVSATFEDFEKFSRFTSASVRRGNKNSKDGCEERSAATSPQNSRRCGAAPPAARGAPHLRCASAFRSARGCGAPRDIIATETFISDGDVPSSTSTCSSTMHRSVPALHPDPGLRPAHRAAAAYARQALQSAVSVLPTVLHPTHHATHTYPCTRVRGMYSRVVHVAARLGGTRVTVSVGTGAV